MSALSPVADFAGRLLIAIIFLASGTGGIIAFDATWAFMESNGLPGIMLIPAIALEIGGGLLMIVGFLTRPVALALAAFTLIAAFVFHFDFGNLTERIMFLKNLAMAGGLLIVFVNGPGRWSIDGRKSR
jgi:putative oxidoreductase